jgi:beta-glucosidase
LGPAAQTVGHRELAKRFPAQFQWGVATSAYQIEGAADEHGRGASIWDVFCSEPGRIGDGSSGASACDHYHRLETDLDLIQSLNVGAYRFSVSWPRVQPLGQGNWNESGFAFYHRLVEGLLSRGIAPHMTLYHWDLPQALQDHGGWFNRDAVHRFADYAAECARRFGDRVASFVTLNEPWVVAHLGHETGVFAPGLKNRGVAVQVSHHLLLAHGLGLQAMRAEGTRAPLGIVLNLSPIHPASNSDDDQAKAKLADGLLVRWYMDPLMRGSYPEDVLLHLEADGPKVRAGDMQTIRQPLDLLGINYYTRGVAAAAIDGAARGRGVEVTDMGWEVYPSGLSELLLRLNTDYVLPPVFITENGAAYVDQLIDGKVIDSERIRYLASHISALADAMCQGVEVRGYFAWSLMDNFEWASGYSKRFGLVFVDFATHERVLKESGRWYRDFLGAWRDTAGHNPQQSVLAGAKCSQI